MIVNELGLIIDIEKFFSWAEVNLLNQKFSLPQIDGLLGEVSVEIQKLTLINIHENNIDLSTGFVLHLRNTELKASFNLASDVTVQLLDINHTETWRLPLVIQSLELDKASSIQLLSNTAVPIATTINTLITTHWNKLSNSIQQLIHESIDNAINKFLHTTTKTASEKLSWQWSEKARGIKNLTLNYRSPEALSLNRSGLAVDIQTPPLINKLVDNGLPSFQIQNMVIMIKQVKVIDENKISLDIETEDGKIRLCAIINLSLAQNHIVQKVEEIHWLEGGFIQKTLFKMLKEYIINKIESRQLNLIEVWDVAIQKLKIDYPFIELEKTVLAEISQLHINRESTSIQCYFTV